MEAGLSLPLSEVCMNPDGSPTTHAPRSDQDVVEATGARSSSGSAEAGATAGLSADLASLRITRGVPAQQAHPHRFKLWAAAAIVTTCVGVATAARTLPQFRTIEVSTTEVRSVSRSQEAAEISAAGYVVPQVTVTVGAKVAGRIVVVRVNEGDKVKAGDALFELDPTDQKSSLAVAQERATAAHVHASASSARILVARANLAETQQQLEREQRLEASGAVPTATVDDLRARARSLVAQVRAEEQNAQASDSDTKAAQAEVRTLATSLGNFVVVSPIDGIAITKSAQVGDVVGPQSSLVQLFDPASLLVEVDVPEGRLSHIQEGSPCEVVLDSDPETHLRGSVVDVVPRVNRAKATVTVKVRILDESRRLYPDMAARVRFLKRALDPAAMAAAPKRVVPASAIAERGGAKVAFLLDDGHARAVPLKLGEATSGGFELADGPAAGTRLIDNPPDAIADGTRLHVKGAD
jgi:RND family efflux transporter MFP subunit